MGRQTPPQRPPQGAIPDVGNQLADLDVELLPDSQKRVGSDWHAVFNPRLRQALDVGLLHTLDHESVVCCVRFSLDGRFIATGCNRVAQIFDVQSGQRVQKLEDASVEKDGDLYIRSVCFSPDGLYLATGAEDKQIRVRSAYYRTRTNTANHSVRSGIFKLVISFRHSPVTSRTSTPLITPRTDSTLPLAAVIEQYGCGISRLGGKRWHSQSKMV